MAQWKSATVANHSGAMEADTISKHGKPCSNMDNPFIGTWSAGSVSIVIDKSTWVAKYGGSVYNSGTYTFEKNTSQLKVTKKGICSAAVGETGTASIYNNIMVVSNLIDTNMNGEYIKN